MTRTMMVGLFLSTALVACGDKDDDTGHVHEADADTDADTATDTDADTDADPDADADAEADADNADNDGTYSGTFEVQIQQVGGDIADTCTGTAELTYDHSLSPQLSGTAVCAFAGALAETLPDEYTAIIDGSSVDTSGDIGGGFSMSVADEIITDDWTGSVMDGTLDSAFDGEFVYAGALTFEYSGGFDTTIQ